MKIKVILFTLILCFAFEHLDAQTKKRRARVKEEQKEESTEEQKPLSDKLVYDIRFGGNLSYGNSFSIGLKPSVGYKFGSVFSAGIGGRLFYTLINQFQTDDISVFDYGTFVYGRAKLGDSFYLQGEYAFMSFDPYIIPRVNINYPVAALGYMNSSGDWNYGAELAIPLNGDARDKGPTYEYWINVNYHF